MAMQLGNGITLKGYLLYEARDVASLKGMYTSYLLEEYERISELAFGNPTAGYLVTSFIRSGGEDVGFVSLDHGQRAVELVYVKPEHRGKGLARVVLEELNRICPQTLALKTPLSPGGEALASTLGLERADNLPHEEAKNQESLRIMREGIKRTCQHKGKGRQGGDPRKLCRRCYQTALRKYANAVIDR
ncbi:GNAT family N-acetyltransferase [Streptomyces sp. OR43]|uniref:GNAT family N-acetyltransferase n=1 Tax=Streptomyces sp. or43 TaxID=2478957 RepID=UPI0011CD89E8|nr:GNAT family N-acetyltransferase [Streptomyces sp. or43]TXS44936.1 GNAT family N-acetyltransferase [Streptomyces sp. or43]